MICWKLTRGVGGVFTVTCRKTDGTAVSLTGSENFTCPYWTGDDQASGGTLSWAYNTPSAGTVDITVSPTVAGLDQGLYQWVLQLPDASAAYARGTFEIMAGPGSDTNTVTPYCTFLDMQNYAPWVQLVSGMDSQAGFMDKRIQARNWLDWIIVRSWRGTSQAYFGDAGRSAQFWLGGWVRRTPIPSQWIQDKLSGSNTYGNNPTQQQALIVRPWVTRVCAYHAIGLVGQGQIGINNQYAAYGRYWKEKADEEVLMQAAELDFNGDGQADLGIPLMAANTLFT